MWAAALHRSAVFHARLLYALLVVTGGQVLLWRGMWGLLDLTLYADWYDYDDDVHCSSTSEFARSRAKSSTVSLIIGHVIGTGLSLFALHIPRRMQQQEAAQQPQSRHTGKWPWHRPLIFLSLYAGNWSTVAAWRGYWYFTEGSIYCDNPLLSLIVCFLVGSAMLGAIGSYFASNSVPTVCPEDDYDTWPEYGLVRDSRIRLAQSVVAYCTGLNRATLWSLRVQTGAPGDRGYNAPSAANDSTSNNSIHHKDDSEGGSLDNSLLARAVAQDRLLASSGTDDDCEEESEEAAGEKGKANGTETEDGGANGEDGGVSNRRQEHVSVDNAALGSASLTGAERRRARSFDESTSTSRPIEKLVDLDEDLFARELRWMDDHRARTRAHPTRVSFSETSVSAGDPASQPLDGTRTEQRDVQGLSTLLLEETAGGLSDSKVAGQEYGEQSGSNGSSTSSSSYYWYSPYLLATRIALMQAKGTLSENARLPDVWKVTAIVFLLEFFIGLWNTIGVTLAWKSFWDYQDRPLWVPWWVTLAIGYALFWMHTAWWAKEAAAGAVEAAQRAESIERSRSIADAEEQTRTTYGWLLGILSADFVNLTVGLFVTICCWKGVWTFMDTYLWPDNDLLSYLVSHFLGLALLLGSNTLVASVGTPAIATSEYFCPSAPMSVVDELRIQYARGGFSTFSANCLTEPAPAHMPEGCRARCR